MSDLAVFDIEADGFLEEVTKIHCICILDYFTGETYRCYNDLDKIVNRLNTDLSLEEGMSILASYKNLCVHNGIGYDIDVIVKVLQDSRVTAINIIDTLVMSQTLNPDRRLPKGCPTSILNTVTGKRDLVTPHSVFAWAWRLGHRKVDNFDWRELSDNILDRCVSDTEIQKEILDVLLEEANIPLEELLKL